VESVYWPSKWYWKVAGWRFVSAEWAVQSQDDSRERQPCSTKTRIGTEIVIDKSDAIPSVNCIWPESFGRKETNKTAIHARDWYPANQMLLYDEDILKTKAASSTATRNESAEEEAAVTMTTDHKTDDILDISNV
jgi:hypothetical protein